MKFIILACFLAVALAKQRMEQYFSSEESMDNSQENFKQNMDMVIFPDQETVKKTAIPQMESVEAPIKNKCYQSIQKFIPSQALKRLYQYHITKNPWGYTVNCAFPSTSTLVSDSISQQQYNQKVMNLSMRSREKTVMSEIKKNTQDYMNNLKRYSKITWPQVVKSLQQYQKTMNLWNYYPYTPLQV